MTFVISGLHVTGKFVSLWEKEPIIDYKILMERLKVSVAGRHTHNGY